MTTESTLPKPIPIGPVQICSFCGKHQSEVRLLISIEGYERKAGICDECIGVCMSALEIKDPDLLDQMIKEAKDYFPAPPPEPMTPEDIVQQLAGLRPRAQLWLSYEDLGDLGKKELTDLANDFCCDIRDDPEGGGTMFTKRK